MKPIPDDIQDDAEKTFDQVIQLGEFIQGMKLSQADALKVACAFCMNWATQMMAEEMPPKFIKELFKGIHNEFMKHIDQCEKRLKEDEE
jgi:predicted DNA-binding transcriptional regulator